MKTIEERADTIADRYVDELHQKIARSSAIESATEQKRDDIEKACKAYCTMCKMDAICISEQMSPICDELQYFKQIISE